MKNEKKKKSWVEPRMVELAVSKTAAVCQNGTVVAAACSSGSGGNATCASGTSA
ncbi:MAG: hypothetical protein HQM10_01940 [Candidatus Riflebacteria bacterium]|nr:hypothetical protein [Candidatus Riflebacteria bacterium]